MLEMKKPKNVDFITEVSPEVKRHVRKALNGSGRILHLVASLVGVNVNGM